MSEATDRETWAPLILFPYEDGTDRWCLMLTDAAMVQVNEVFERRSRISNGYAWTGVAKTALRTNEIDDTDVSFDPEAGMFVAYGKNVASLRALGDVLRDAFHDTDALVALVDASDPDEMD